MLAQPCGLLPCGRCGLGGGGDKGDGDADGRAFGKEGVDVVVFGEEGGVQL